MKNYRIYFLFVSLLFLWSCEDAIYIDPKDEIVESNAITNIDDAEDALIGVYATLGKTTAIYWNSLFTDEVQVAGGNNGQGIQTHTWSINSQNGESAGIWATYSGTIGAVNRVLAAYENVVPEDADEEALLDEFRGELYAIRAWAHMNLMFYYTPSFTDMNALSVPYVDYRVVLEKPNRNTLGEVLAGINSDLDMAASMIPAGANENFFMTRDAVTAMRARIALYIQDYDSAITHAETLIQNYSLPSMAEYPSIWTDESETGVIFKLARVTGNGAVGQIYNPSPQLTYFNPSEEIRNAYEANDIREDVFFNGDRIWKYPGTAGVIGLNDIKVFRVSEMYLIRAEASLRLPTADVQQAEDDYNALRSNRIAGYTPEDFTTSSAALELVMEERFRELAFEGHRFLDLKRTNSPVDRLAPDCEDLSADACFLEASSHLWALPIPEAEIDVNPDMQQNPGY